MIFVAAIDVLFIVVFLIVYAVAFFQFGRGFEIGKHRAAGEAINRHLIEKFDGKPRK